MYVCNTYMYIYVHIKYTHTHTHTHTHTVIYFNHQEKASGHACTLHWGELRGGANCIRKFNVGFQLIKRQQVERVRCANKKKKTDRGVCVVEVNRRRRYKVGNAIRDRKLCSGGRTHEISLEHVCLKQRPLQATHRILIPLLTVPEGIL